MSDDEIRGFMVGSWVVDPKDDTYGDGGGAISTYRRDGTVDFSSFEDVGCSSPHFRTRANWTIEDGKLFIVVRSSERPDIHPPGLVVRDKVRSINAKSKVLEAESGHVQYRLRSESCIAEEI